MVKDKNLSQLELLPSKPFRKIIKMTRLSELKSLRLTSKTLRDRIEREENKLFKHWMFIHIEQDAKRIISASDINWFSKDVKIVEGLELIMASIKLELWLPALKLLKINHPEMKDLRLVFHSSQFMEDMTDLLQYKYRHSSGDCRQLNSEGKKALKELITWELYKAHRLGKQKPWVKFLQLRGMEASDKFSTLECVNVSEKEIVPILQFEGVKKLFITHLFSTGVGFKVLEKHDPLLLNELKFAQCPRLTDQGLMAILKNLPALKILRLQETSISGQKFSELSLEYVPQLVELNLQKCPKLTDSGLVEMLKKIGAKLKVLRLNSTNITGEIFAKAALKLTPKLKFLDLTECKKMTDFGFISIFAALGKELTTLKASHTLISGECFAGNLSFQAKLENLELLHCLKLSDLGLLAMLSKLNNNLKVLRISGSKITGKRLAEFKPKKPPVLEILDLSSCSKVCDGGLKVFLEKFGAKLNNLQLRKTGITGESFEDLCVDCPQLKELDLSGSKVTDEGLVNMLNKIGNNLITLNLSDTNISGENFDEVNVDLSSIEKLSLKNCKNLTIEGLVMILKCLGGEVKEIDTKGTDCSHLQPMSKSHKATKGLNMMSLLDDVLD